MCSRNPARSFAGFTLVEMIIAIVIIGAGLAGVLTAFNVNVKSSADPMVRKQMLAIAEEMMEEIVIKPYAVGGGGIAGCDRTMADDIFDYGTYANQPICDIDGTQIAGLSAYTVSVAISPETVAGVPMQRIVVTVSRGAANTLQLTGRRTDYAS